jgi:hypothetical protein
MAHLGEVKATKVRCDSSYSPQIDREVSESAATSFRGKKTFDVAAAYALRPFASFRDHGPRKVGR